MSLYRKYRPQNFANLVGQEHVRVTLRNALKMNNVNHAYLFTGPRGTGKTSTARLLAKAINCEHLAENSEPCETCEICQDITDGRLIDLIEIDAASNRGIDEIRDLREKIQFAPTRAKNKVYIIDEVHMLTKEAFNALLKTLEEPPTRVYFILATTEVHKIPETILSRCQRFDFKRIEDQVLLDRLGFIAKSENIEAEKPALQAIVHHVQGGLRDAIGLMEQLSVDGKLTLAHVQEVLGISGKMSIEKLYHLMRDNSVRTALEEIGALYAEGYDLVQFNKDFLEFLRQRMLKSVAAEDVQETKIFLVWIRFFQESYESLKYTTIAQLPLEMAIIQACYFQNSGKNLTHHEVVSDSHDLQKNTAKASPQNKFPDLAEMPKKDPQQPAQYNDGRKEQVELSLTALKVKWSSVPTQMKNATARRLFSSFKMKELKGHELYLMFQTQFHLSKIMETTNRMDFEEALFKVFGVHFKIVPVLQEMHLAMENANEQSVERTDRNLADSHDDQAGKLLEIFGGEMVGT